ncbi:MAG: acetyl-CoA carboxylase biotin carboxyl carrier protein [Chloroflexota bacterium]
MDDAERDLQDIVIALQGSDIAELEIQDGPNRVRLHRSQDMREMSVPLAFQQTPVERTAGPHIAAIVSPLVGTFYRAGKPGSAPLVSEGSRVDDGTVVGIIEALQELTDVMARCDGSVVEALATDGQPVEYGQTLFRVEIDD